MIQDIKEFGNGLTPGTVGLFFYAAHGAQVEGENFLIPVGADINKAEEVELEAVNINQVLKRMEGAKNRLNVLILDPGINNPFERSFRSVEQGLAMGLPT